jgi:DNA-nicking Smr family endonuclease
MKPAPKPVKPPVGPAAPHKRPAAVRSVAPAKPAPASRETQAAAYGYADRAAFQQAFAGVRPLEGAPKGRGVPAPRAAAAAVDAREDAARLRLDQLVAGAVRFDVRYEDDGSLIGTRRGAHPSHLRGLEGGVAPQATLDLHGRLGDDAAREVGRFVREAFDAGDRTLIIIHGKGLHSAGERGVLGDRVVAALTRGGAAPLVLAFRTAPTRLGGLGALVVRLGQR